MKTPLLAGATAALFLSAALLVSGGVSAAPAKGKPAAKPAAKSAKPATKTAAAKPAASTAGMVAVQSVIKNPRPGYLNTPRNIKVTALMEKPGTVQPDLMVPKGITNVALGKKVTSSDENPIIGSLDLITDGEKEATDGTWVELGPGKQWVQIDLEKAQKIYAVAVWHYHGEARIYRDFVVQVSDDPDFITGVKTLYNNDHDNSSGMGLGKDKEYIESHRGRIVAGKGVAGRYVRLYTKGSTADDQNAYMEVEVYALP